MDDTKLYEDLARHLDQGIVGTPKSPALIEILKILFPVAEAEFAVRMPMQNKTLLASLPLSFWQDALGDDVAQEIAPDGQLDPMALDQILPTLPQDMKNTLETQLAAYNR